MSMINFGAKSILVSKIDLLRKQYRAQNRGRAPDKKRSVLEVREHRSPSLTKSLGARRPFAVGLMTHKMIYILLGTVFLTISSWVSVPMFPVPVTMQTYAVLLLAGMCGSRLAVITVFAWLGEAALGLPVLAGGVGGLARVMGPIGGYLVGFLACAWMIAKLFESKPQTHHTLNSFMLMLLGHAIILVFGFVWLAQFIGWENAFYFGIMPFLWGSVLKSIFAVLTIRLLQKDNS